MMNKIDIKIFEKYKSDLNIVEGQKLSAIVKWLNEVLIEALKNDDISVNSLMPKKNEFAKLLNVGLGTVQNAYRSLEDMGILLSKQCVGTIFVNNNVPENFSKLTSKKEIILNSLKKYFKKNNLKTGDKLKPIRFFAKKMKVSTSLILQAFEQLEILGIIEKKDGSRCIKSLDFKVVTEQYSTLPDKIYSDIKNYIVENLKIGDKLPPLNILAKKYNVSVKTVHSALKKFIDGGILISLAGKYGTTVVKIPSDTVFYQEPEISIFASSKETYYYHYEKILNIIRKMIIDNFEVGSKLPSISELSLLMDVNPNTIRKSFEVLKSEGLVTTVRGRYGGTFVLEIPDVETTQSYQWLAVNSDFSM